MEPPEPMDLLFRSPLRSEQGGCVRLVGCPCWGAAGLALPLPRMRMPLRSRREMGGVTARGPTPGRRGDRCHRLEWAGAAAAPNASIPELVREDAGERALA